MKLTWMKYRAGGWSQLNDLNLRAPQFDNLEGVYVIWHGVETGAYVRVGQGKIREKLQFYQMDPEVQAFKALSLFVTCTSVLERFRDSVEAFLVKELRPKLGSVTPHIDPIPVNPAIGTRNVGEPPLTPFAGEKRFRKQGLSLCVSRMGPSETDEAALSVVPQLVEPNDLFWSRRKVKAYEKQKPCSYVEHVRALRIRRVQPQKVKCRDISPGDEVFEPGTWAP